LHTGFRLVPTPMTLNAVIAPILRFCTEFDRFSGRLYHSGWRYTYNVRKILSSTFGENYNAACILLDIVQLNRQGLVKKALCKKLKKVTGRTLKSCISHIWGEPPINPTVTKFCMWDPFPENQLCQMLSLLSQVFFGGGDPEKWLFPLTWRANFTTAWDGRPCWTLILVCNQPATQGQLSLSSLRGQ